MVTRHLRRALLAALAILGSTASGQALELDTVMNRVLQNVQKINSYEADAWIKECSWAQVCAESIGRYYYYSPDSARLEQRLVNGVDTSWVTYTAAYPCGVALAIGTITLPLQSPSTYQAWSANGAIVTDSTTFCLVRYTTGGGATYVYTVDKARWLPIRLAVSGTIAYTATYGWDAATDVPVLRMVALKNDTTMAWGGVIFSNTVVNGVMSVREAGSARVSAPSAASAHWRIVIAPSLSGSRPSPFVGIPANLLGRSAGAVSGAKLAPGVFVTRR
jgi:hypothetical protein